MQSSDDVLTKTNQQEKYFESFFFTPSHKFKNCRCVASGISVTV